MGNFKHQSIRDRDKERERDGDKDRERDIRDREGQERLRHVRKTFTIPIVIARLTHVCLSFLTSMIVTD